MVNVTNLGLNPATLEALLQAKQLGNTPKKKPTVTAKSAAKLGLNLEDIGAVGGLLRTQEHIPYEERPEVARIANAENIETPLDNNLEGVEIDKPRLFF